MSTLCKLFPQDTAGGERAGLRWKANDGAGEHALSSSSLCLGCAWWVAWLKYIAAIRLHSDLRMIKNTDSIM